MLFAFYWDNSHGVRGNLFTILGGKVVKQIEIAHITKRFRFPHFKKRQYWREIDTFALLEVDKSTKMLIFYWDILSFVSKDVQNGKKCSPFIDQWGSIPCVTSGYIFFHLSWAWSKTSKVKIEAIKYRNIQKHCFRSAWNWIIRIMHLIIVTRFKL